MIRFAAALAFAAALFAAPAAYARDNIVTLTYVAPEGVQAGSPSITLGAVTDGREHAADWLGAIRGGYGNPLKTLRTQGPVTATVETALRAGVDARSLTAASGPHRLDVRVAQFDCNQYARKEAHVILELTLVDAQSGASLYSKTTRVDRVEGSIMTLRSGIFASVEDLRAVANAALQEAIDQALDDPGLRAALAQTVAASAAASAVGETPPAAAAPATP